MFDGQSVGRTKQARNVANNTGSRGLIWAAVGSCPCDNDEKVEQRTERSYTDDNRRDGGVDLPQASGEDTSQ